MPIQRQNESSATIESPLDIDYDDIDLLATNYTIRHKIPPRPKPVIVNLQSQTPSSSIATQSLLYELAARAVLPKSCDGMQAAVVWLDTRNSFSATRLLTTIISSIQRLNGDSTALDTYNTNAILGQAKDALLYVHVISNSSPAQLLKSLEDLPPYLSNCTAHHSSSRTLGLIVLDSATQFYWQDRFEAELARLNALSTSPERGDATAVNQPQSFSKALSTRIAMQLRSLAARYECAVLYTTNMLDFHSSTDSTLPVSDVWTNTALTTLTTKRADVTQFAPQMSIQDCLRDRQKRQEAVAAGRVRYTASAAGKNVGSFDATATNHGLQF